MARVTVEDCVKVIPNRFELSLIAGKRAKEILSGSPAVIDKKGEKYTVTALREIGDGLIDVEKVRENILCDLKNKKVIDYYDTKKPSMSAKTEIEEELLEEEILDEEDLDLEDEEDLDDEDDLENEEEDEDFQEDE
ncbi:DNA-directed RNA polymerase subunit omega [Pseudomonadota bacterium]